MKNMIFESGTKQIIFDDFTDNRAEYGSYWAEMCPCCYEKCKDILGSRVDDGGIAQGTCCVKGCWNDADFYVDFDEKEVRIVDEMEERIMEIRLEMENWIINDEYFITEGINEYEVYNCGTDEEKANELFSSTSFEECLTWIWNSL